MQLEFRAFHKEKKIMCQVLLICFVNKYVDVLPDYQLEGGNQEEWKFEDIELMAYTGLNDKNNKMIFEGDVIFIEYNNIGHHVVRFVNGHFNCFTYRMDRCVVAGNVFETPSLRYKK